LSASTNVSGVVAIAGSFRVFIAVLRWNDPSPHSQIRQGTFAFGLDHTTTMFRDLGID
jgi:hypothetical protein